MPQGRELLLDREDQLALTMELHRRDLIGVKENPKDYIKLKSGRMSPHYLDMRPGVSSTHFRHVVAEKMGKLAHARVPAQGFDYPHEAYAHAVGTPEAMTSYAVNIAEELGVSLLQPRVVTKKASGNVVPILGRHKKGDNVADFDDVVNDGESKRDAINQLRAQGLNVLDYFVVLDREEGGAPEVLEQTGVEITPALSMSNMAIMLFAEGEISITQYDNVRQYMSEYGDPVAREALGIAA